uniref:Fibronectin type-III domain-containing protein n=1 Tax=Macrostomum lignano TaxID=282301 RepID=A0A1I8IR04_9PLAT
MNHLPTPTASRNSDSPSTGPCVLSFHLPELSDSSDAASDNGVHRRRFDLTSDSGSQLRVHRRSTAGQRQIRLMDLTTKSVSRTTVLAQLGDLAVWMFNSPDDAVKAVQSLNAKSLDVQSRIVEQCLDSPGPVTVSNVSLFVAQDADRSMQELDFDATVGMSVSTGKVRPSLVTVPRGGCVLISLSGSGNSEQPNSELHKIDNDGKKSANKQDNDDGVKIDKINPEKFRCIFNRCGIYRFSMMTESGSIGGGLACVIVLWRPELTPKPQLDWSAGTPQFRCGRAEDAVEPVDVYFTTDGSCPWPHRESVRVARPGQPIKLPPSTSLDQTICIRAVAISQHRLASQLLTEFCQIDSSINGANDDGEPEQADSAQLTVTAPMGVLTDQWLWFNSIATIRLVEVADGTIEVFWRKSAVPVSHSVYHLLVNGARWASGEPSNCCYRLGGLAAGREYTIQVVAAIADSATNSTQTGCYPDLLSNELRYNCPCWSTERGPLISMELLADAEDSAAVVWAALPLSRTSALIGYKVSLNGLQCGRLVTPEADGQRCRVVIEGCELNRKHSLMVNAVWTDQTGETFELPSNRLQFRLPLPKPLTAASEVDAAAAAATSESLLLFEGVCEHQQVLAAAQAEAAADKIAADEMESSSNQQEQEKQNQEEDRSKQNGEKLANKTDEQNKSEAKNKKEKPRQKNQQKQKKENEDKKTEAKKVAKTEEGRSNNGKERKEDSQTELAAAAAVASDSADNNKDSNKDTADIACQYEDDFEDEYRAATALATVANGDEDKSEDRWSISESSDAGENESADKSRKISKKGGRSGAGASASRLDSIFEPFDSMSANLWRHLRSTVSVAGRRFRQEGGGGGGEAAGSGGEAESQGAARRSWSCGPAARELVCGGLETGCDYIIHVISAFAAVENSSSLGERISRSAPVAFKAGSTASVPLTSAGNDVDASQKASSSKQKVQMLQKEQQQPPPIPQPRLFAVSSGPNRVAVRWAFDESAATSGVELAGYQLLINGARRGGLLPSQTSQTTLEPLRPGRTIRVAVQAAA